MPDWLPVVDGPAVFKTHGTAFANPRSVGTGFLSRSPTSPFAKEVLCVTSICSAIRLLACLVLSQIGSPFQLNLYHQIFPRL